VIGRRVVQAAVRLLAGRPSALIVPVPGLPFDPPGEPGLPHHVTVVYPFVRARMPARAVRKRLRSAFATVRPFEFRLTAVGRFPGVLYLAPDSAEPFVALTEASVRAVPSHLPYRGAFDAIVPHVTVLEHAPEPEGLEERLRSALPITARADFVELYAPGTDGIWRSRMRFPLGDTRTEN
jgi:2'-5' RNA ligase